MNLFACFAILAASIVLSESFLFDSLEENISVDRIVGGKTANPGQFKYQVSLRGIPTNTHRCGGSIISTRWVVSAAHCTQGRFATPTGVAIVVGAHHIRDDGQVYRLERIVNHPRYHRPTIKNDICLLQTTITIQFGERVGLIPLRRKHVGNALSTVSGWGAIRFPGGPPTHLQFLRVNTTTNEECRALHTQNVWPAITNTTICAFSQLGQGTCFGDSGGPLTSKRKLIGVVSWVVPCARGRPDGYARVSVFVKWIQEVSGVRAV